MTDPTFAPAETPLLLLDEARMQANCARMRDRVRALGARFRPHVKTAKSLAVTRAMLGATHGPITVSTLREADEFAAHGFTDITYAIGITPNKLIARRLDIAESTVKIHVSAILRELRVTSRTQALIAVARAGVRLPAL